LTVEIVRVLVMGQQYSVYVADRVDADGRVAGFD